MRKFLVSLSDINLERGKYREWQELLREPDWRKKAKFLERIQELLDRLPPLERDVIELCF